MFNGRRAAHGGQFGASRIVHATSAGSLEIRELHRFRTGLRRSSGDEEESVQAANASRFSPTGNVR
jgi:hypothetical protein